ncbi:SIR2 family protein [Candidatus Nitrosocosmicus agrestis]|uniref:SIR2 family protein n=1 Tax=Candidatus Nitrosocosmicus agrestis TaxID=2563600 RepID=UPI001331985F|nr:SIR2 family protein [Candidatus Nitrosocosmicus sp. SS]
MFLLGAGASVPAKLPSMAELTTSYYYSVEQSFSTEEKEAVRILKDVMNQTSTIRNDIEGLMSIVKNLEDEQYRDLIYSKFNDLKQIDTMTLNQINLKTQAFIRKSLETINKNSHEFLSPLQGFIDGDPTEIFTLNYDGLIDLFCERNRIKYVDGFSPYWNPSAFNELEQSINLYRLHGCLYWFKTESGKSVKVPIIGMDLNEVAYISSEKLSEIIIYPTFKKEKTSQIFSWLNNQFNESIRKCTLLIVIGYSFRDADITTIIRESLQSQNLWLLIISPSASKITSDDLGIKAVNLDIQSRILRINASFQDILNKGNLYDTVKKLLLIIGAEREVLKRYYQTPRDNTHMPLLIDSCYYMGWEDRVSYLKEIVRPFYTESELRNVFYNRVRSKEDDLESSMDELLEIYGMR